MNENGFLIPLGRGKEIGLEKLMDRVRAIQEEWTAVHDQVAKSQVWREKLLNQEREKPMEQWNMNLIDALEAELKDLDALEEKACKHYGEACDKWNELNEQLLAEMDRTELAEIERELAEYKKEAEFFQKKEGDI